MGFFSVLLLAAGSISGVCIIVNLMRVAANEYGAGDALFYSVLCCAFFFTMFAIFDAEDDQKEKPKITKTEPVKKVAVQQVTPQEKPKPTSKPPEKPVVKPKVKESPQALYLGYYNNCMNTIDVSYTPEDEIALSKVCHSNAMSASGQAQ